MRAANKLQQSEEDRMFEAEWLKEIGVHLSL